MAEIVGNAWEK